MGIIGWGRVWGGELVVVDDEDDEEDEDDAETDEDELFM